MKVNDLHSALRGVDPREVAKSSRPTPEKVANPRQESVDGDSLDLSLSSRISAASVDGSAAAPEAESELSPARIAEIRGRIQSGFYTQPGPMPDIAERILNYYSR